MKKAIRWVLIMGVLVGAVFWLRQTYPDKSGIREKPERQIARLWLPLHVRGSDQFLGAQNGLSKFAQRLGDDARSRNAPKTLSPHAPTETCVRLP